jgi:hypothetical protein
MIKNRKLLKRREKKKKTEFDQAYNQNTWSFKHMHAFKERERESWQHFIANTFNNIK